MENVKPNRELFILPEGSIERSYGGPGVGQPQYFELPAIVTPDGKLLTQWRPSPGELELLAQGVPITLELHTSGRCPPMRVYLGGADLRERVLSGGPAVES